MALMPKSSPSMLKLAKRGAESRLRELSFEVENLLRLFPHLHDSIDADELPISFILKRGAARAAKKKAAEAKKKTPARP